MVKKSAVVPVVVEDAAFGLPFALAYYRNHADTEKVGESWFADALG
jgi:hypothetical protein